MIEMRDQARDALLVDLTPAIQIGLLGVSKQIEAIVAPYPSAPAQGNPWYERGFGTRYQRKDGKITGRKTSETLGRRWVVLSRSRMQVVLLNNASYSGYIHDSEYQTTRHAATGWKTEQDAERELSDADVADTMRTPILKQLGA